MKKKQKKKKKKKKKKKTKKKKQKQKKNDEESLNESYNHTLFTRGFCIHFLNFFFYCIFKSMGFIDN